MPSTEIATVDETRSIAVMGVSPLALMDDVDLAQIMADKLTPVAEWTYSFSVKGQNVTGVSVRGAQDAARALATQGEAIRVIDVRLDKENDREAYFVARAGRYAIAPDGREILTDTTIRGKRQPKFIKLQSGGEMPNEFWFEIGISKASRNAIDALLPEALRQCMKAEARKKAPAGAKQTAARPADTRGAERAFARVEAEKRPTPQPVAAPVDTETGEVLDDEKRGEEFGQFLLAESQVAPAPTEGRPCVWSGCPKVMGDPEYIAASIKAYKAVLCSQHQAEKAALDAAGRALRRE